MTVAVQTPTISYTENGSTTAFAVPFRYDAPTDLRAVRRAVDGTETELTYGTDFTATAGPTNAGGTLTVTTAAAAGVQLTILRATARSQLANYTTSGPFTAESHERAMDKNMLVAQEQDAMLARALMVAPGQTALVVGEIDDGQVLGLIDGKLRGVANNSAEAELAAIRAEAALALAEEERITAQAASSGAQAARTGAETAQALAQAAAAIAADLGSATIYGALAGLPTANGTRGWAIIPFGADQGIYEDTGSWTRRADTAAVQAQAKVDLAADEANRAEVAAAAAQAAISQSISKFTDIVRFVGMERRSPLLAGTVGRAYMLPTGAFAFTTSTEQERPHYEAGRRAGYYLQPAAAYVGANAQATALTGAQAITTVGSGTGDPVAAQAHSAPDRFGGTGKALLINQRTTGGGRRQWQGASVSVVSGDVVRMSCKLHINNTPSAGSTFTPMILRASSGSANGARVTLNFDASGAILPSSIAAVSAPLRFGLTPLEVIGGKQVWFVWVDTVAAATGTVYAEYIEPTAVVGVQMVFHDCPLLELNPTAPPNPLPIGGTKTYAADRILIGSASEAFEADFWRIARTHSRQAGNALDVPNPAIQGNRTAISGPTWPYENRIEIAPASEATGFAGLLPSYDSLLDVSQLGTFRSPVIRAKGFFADPIVGSSATASPVDIRGFSSTDWTKLPWMAFNTSRSHVSTLRFDGVVYSASSEFPTQFGQVGTGDNVINTIGFATGFTSEILGLVSHPWTHGRLRVRNPYGSSAANDEGFYVGTNLFSTQTATFTASNVFAHGVGRATQFTANGVSNVVTFNINTLLIERYSSDAMYLSPGTFSGVIENFIFADASFTRLNFYQTAPDMPIWVDYGAGWVSIVARAASLSLTVPQTLALLPLNRRYTYFGEMGVAYGTTRDLDDLLIDPNDDTWIAVPQFEQDAPSAASSTNTPGFQFHASQMHLPDGTRRENIPYDSAWISTNGRAASATNPHILLVRGNGRYHATGGAWTPYNDPLEASVYPQSGTHPDALQVNVTNTRVTGMTFRNFIIRSESQGGFYLNGMATDALGTVTIENGIIAVTGTNAVFLSKSSTSGGVTVENVMLGNALIPDRFNDGSVNSPRYRSNGTPLTLTNCFALVQQNVDGIGEENTGVATGAGVVTGLPRIIRAPNVDGTTFTTPTPTYSGGSVDKATLVMLTGDNAAMNDRGMFSVNGELSEWQFTDFAVRHLGWDVNEPLRKVFRGAVDFRAWGNFITYVLHQDPIAHAQITNAAAVDSEVVLYADFDTDQDEIVRLPGHTIDPLFGDGYGVHGHFRISEDGRVFVRRSLAGADHFHRILTRKPDGSYGPIVTIDVRVP